MKQSVVTVVADSVLPLATDSVTARWLSGALAASTSVTV